MKKLLIGIMLLAMLLTSVTVCAEGAVVHSLLPFAEVYWGDTRDALIERLGIAFPGPDEDRLISTTTVDDLTLSVVYNFEAGEISGITVFTDGIGKEEYRENCAEIYDAMLESVITAYGETAVVEASDTWSSEADEAAYGSGNLSIPMWEGKLKRMCSIKTGYASASALFMLSGNTLNIGYIVEPFKVDTGIWKTKAYTDEFDMPTDDYFIVSDPIIGKFSNSATTNSKLEVYVFCQDFSDTHEDYIKFRLFEYGSYRVDNSYSSGEYYDVTMMDADGNKYYLEGYIPSKSSDIRVYYADAQIIISALKAGGIVRFVIAPTEYSQTKYSFVIEDATGFDAIYQQWK